MSTSATPPTSPAAPATPAVARNSTAGNGPGGLQPRQAPADLFATLLALAADTGTPADGAAGIDPLAADADGAAADTDRAPADNPLAGLLMWQPPGLLRETGAGGETANAALGDRAAALATSEPKPEGGEVANPASPATPQTGKAPALSWQVAATRAAQTQSPTNATQAAGPGAADLPAIRWTHAAAAADPGAAALPSRSTVAMDARYQPAPGAWREAAPGGNAAIDGSTAPGGLPGERLAVGAPAAGQPADAGGGHAGGDGETASGHATDEARGPEDLLPADAEAVEVQHWGTPTLRQASVRVGDEPGQAIDIQLALRGDELRLDIRTDDSAAREALRDQAQTALADRLAQGGLQLGSVSVGTHGQGQGQGRDAPTQATPTTRQGPSTDLASAAEAVSGRTPPGTKPGLDLFI